jgi:thiol-disulfide isomerase/thioredoxin
LAIDWNRLGEDERAMRRVILLLVMVGGIGLVVWAGVHNLRARRRAAEKLQEERAVLVPDGASSGAAGTVAASTEYKQASPLKNKPAPQFALVDLAGKKVSLSDFKGKPVVVNFWGTYCEPCKVEMPWLEEFSKKYAADGFEVLGVTYDVEAGNEKIGREARKLGVTYPILLSDPKVEKAYLGDTEVLPVSFYVNKAGSVVEVTAGLGSKDQLEAMVKETIAGGVTQ